MAGKHLRALLETLKRKVDKSSSFTFCKLLRLLMTHLKIKIRHSFPSKMKSFKKFEPLFYQVRESQHQHVTTRTSVYSFEDTVPLSKIQWDKKSENSPTDCENVERPQYIREWVASSSDVEIVRLSMKQMLESWGIQHQFEEKKKSIHSAMDTLDFIVKGAVDDDDSSGKVFRE